MNPRSREYLLPILVWLPAEVPAAVVEDAVERTVARHEVLRTRYAMDGEGLFAVVEPPGHVPVVLRRVDTSPEQVADAVAEQLGSGFDLAAAPLLRAALIRDGGAEQLLLVVCHHIVGDGWSSHLLERELRASVAALADGGVPDLPAPAVRYTDAVAWQRAELTADVLADQLAYWRKTLADAPELELPGMRPRPAVRGIEGDAVVVDLPAASADALLALGRRAGTTPYVVLLTLWAVALARTSGAWDLTVGTPHAGRTRPELHDVVGLFLNTVVLRTQLAPDATFAEAVAAVDGVCREAFARHAAPFEAVADAVLPARDASRTPLFQNLFALVGDGMIGQVPRERDLGLLGRAWKVARTDLALTLWPRPDGGYGGALEFSTELYGTAVAAGLAARLRDLAARFAADPRLPIGSATLPTTAAEAAESAAGPAAEGPDVEVDDARLETVLGLVRELLEQPDLGPGDDFMAAGGTSLLAARLLWGVQNAFGVEVSMRAFFDRPTAADLAAAVGDLLPAGPPGTGGEEDGREPVAALVDSPVAPGGPTERDA
jgi:acyl carrier protein